MSAIRHYHQQVKIAVRTRCIPCRRTKKDDTQRVDRLYGTFYEFIQKALVRS